jgi:hypothetical protein
MNADERRCLAKGNDDDVRTISNLKFEISNEGQRRWNQAYLATSGDERGFTLTANRE